MIRIKMTEGDKVRKIDLTKIGQEVRITMMRCPVFIVDIEEVTITTIVISRETFIEEMRKFLEELEA